MNAPLNANPTRKSSNETQGNINHHVCALDPLLRISLHDGSAESVQDAAQVVERPADRSEERGLGEVGPTEGATQFTKNLLERREGRHLIGPASIPERSQTGLFSRERGLQLLAGFFTEFQFL